MPSNVFDSVLLKHLWGTDELRAVFSDQNRVQKWFDYEAALALSQAELGIIPTVAARDIAAKALVENIDLESVAADIRRTKHPLVPALSALQKVCSTDSREYLHFGPTTQDVLDTGTMLQVRQAHSIFLRDLKIMGRELFRLAEAYKDTPMAGRSHCIQALPITFGHKCAIWLSETARNYERLRQLETRTFVGSLVGAVGTKASFGEKAFELDAQLMGRLGLGVAEISWQPARDRLVEYVSILAIVGGSAARIANEILTLAHSEIDELNEPFSEGKVGSSTMPHKRNPTVVENVVTVATALRYDMALMHEALVQEHERDGAAWKIEWKALPEACLMTGVILAQMKYVLTGLEVNIKRMRRNLDVLGGYLMSERVMFVLAKKLGKQTAHDAVYEASMRGIASGIPFEKALMDQPRIRSAITREELLAALDPTTYVGMAPRIVEMVLRDTEQNGWLACQEVQAPLDAGAAGGAG